MNEDKDLEKLINSLMDEAPIEAPSDNFTNLVVAKVEEIKKTKLVFKPLISWKTFLLWVIVLGGLTFYLVSSDGPFNANVGIYLSTFSDARNWFSHMLPEFQLSKKMIYMTGAFGIMIYFQSLLLKRFFKGEAV